MLKRYPFNPIVTRYDIPEINSNLVDVTSVFNPGAVLYHGKVLLMLRVQNRGRETFFVMAESEDGFNFVVDSKVVEFKGIGKFREKIHHCYDPRITKIDNEYYIMFAMDVDAGCRLGLASTKDFCEFEFMGVVSNDDVRNGVLFSEKIAGKYIRFERPNKHKLSSGAVSGNSISISESEDLINWNRTSEIASGRNYYWDELIGSGPPPVKTREGWLHIYHGIARHLNSIFIYQVGVMLHDLNDPSKLLSRGRYNILEPRENYELIGQVPNVCFPTGIIVDSYDNENYALNSSRVRIYYGAADTSVCVAAATIGDLLNDAKQT